MAGLLPIDQVASHLVACLRTGNRLVISAPTGSGKSTRTPIIVHQANLITGQIIILQPRRLATRLLAQRVAQQMQTPVGTLVGYQTRFESQVSDQTQILFMTQGLFLRRMSESPQLTGVGMVILDEFHERPLSADLALAWIKHLQQTTRPQLKLIVMSATLDTARLTDYLQCELLESHGSMFPVTVQYYRAAHRQTPCWEQAADALSGLLAKQTQGDVLVFMPGLYEIRRTIETGQQRCADQGLIWRALHADLSAPEQDDAVKPAPPGQRKIIVATNVAETSITLEGVRHVIDSGLVRMHRHDPRRGINVLLIEPISQASAQQRTGRAGRLGTGVCIRLWPESEHASRPSHTAPEINRLDMSEVLMQLLSLGITAWASVDWLDQPRPAALQQATAVLERIGAIAPAPAPAGQSQWQLTSVGQRMRRLPMHPRLARMLVAVAENQGDLQRACLWAALISERDLFLRGGQKRWMDQTDLTPRSDLLIMEKAFHTAVALRLDAERCAQQGLQSSACREIEHTTRLYQRACVAAGLGDDQRGDVSTSSSTFSSASSASLASTLPLLKGLLQAFWDHLAIRKNPAQPACAMLGGRRGELDPLSLAQRPGLLLPLEITEIGSGLQANVRTQLSVVSEIEEAWLSDIPGRQLTLRMDHLWSKERQAVIRVEQLWFEDLLIREPERGEAEAEPAARILSEMILSRELRIEGWDEHVEQWITRVRCVHQWFPERPLLAYEEDDLRVILQEWCQGCSRASQVRDKPLLDAMQNALSWEDQQWVEKQAPRKLILPTGRPMTLHYTLQAPPRGQALIQDLFDWQHSPTIASGRQKVVLEILAPSRRPVQMTDDLAGFWKNLYPQIRPQLARKYPRHVWR